CRTRGSARTRRKRGKFHLTGSVVGLNFRFGEGFRTPAPCGTVVRVVGPAYESLPRRKPRGGWGLVVGAGCGGWLGGRALWGFWRHGPSAGGTSGAGDEDSSRRERRRRALLRRTVRAAGEGAAPGEGLASLRGRRLPAPARGWRRRRGEKWLRGGAAMVMRCRSGCGSGMVISQGAGLRRSRR